jgi:D-alanyl-D-alanine carboxypeptidase
MIAAMAVTLSRNVRAAARCLSLVALLAAGAAGCAAVPLEAAPTASLRAGPSSAGASTASPGSRSAAPSVAAASSEPSSPGSTSASALAATALPSTTASAAVSPGASAAPSTSSPPPPSAGSSAVPSVALQAAVARFVRRSGTPGISVTVRWSDGRTWTGTAGFADLRHRTPVRPDTAFAIASMSKTFTAAVILQLVEEGRIGLEDSVDRYLPGQHLDRRITVRMLLDHTSGLYDVFLAPGIDAALQSAPARRWTVARALGYKLKRYFAPGRGWHYSNTNYLVLGLLAERVTGHSLASEIHRRFLAPLRLARTWTQVREPPLAPVAHGYVVSGSRKTVHQRDLSDGTAAAPFTSVVTAIDGAGSVASTSADLAAWAADLYGGRVLSTATLGTMVADQQRTVAYIPGVLYGLGVQLYAVGPWTTLGHSGRLLGFRGQMRYVPATGTSIAALTNQSRTDVAPLIRQLLAIVLPPLGTPGGRVR